MDIRDLIYFEVIAEEGNLGKAADRLGRTKPALTKCVRRLEQEIGAPLFVRVGRRTALTAPGKTLVVHAKHLRCALDDALKDVSDLASGQTGHVRIGMGTTVVDYLRPQISRWFLADAPKATLEIRVGLSDILRAHLIEGRVDAIITTALPGDDEAFAKQDWFTDEVVVATRKGHPLQGRRNKIEDLVSYQWILPGPGVPSRQWIDWAFRSRHLAQPQARAEINAIELMPALIGDSDLLGFLPRRFLAPGRLAADLVELPIKATTMRRTLSFLSRKGGYIPPALRSLANRLRLSRDGRLAPSTERRSAKRRTSLRS
jgi:DNA-binding transcriptional LysR family regulator